MAESVSKKKEHFSFAVGSKYGPRSAKWIVSVEKDDIFISTEKDRKLWHVSLHSSGRWHLRSHDKKGAPPLIKLHRRDVPRGKYPVGLHIAIPDSCLRPASDPDRIGVPDLWLPRPSYGGSVEIAVMKWNMALDLKEIPGVEEWPGKAAGTKLFAEFCFDHDTKLGLFVRYLNADDAISRSINEAVNKIIARYQPIVLDSPERRGYFFASSVGEAILISEFAID